MNSEPRRNKHNIKKNTQQTTLKQKQYQEKQTTNNIKKNKQQTIHNINKQQTTNNNVSGDGDREALARLWDFRTRSYSLQQTTNNNNSNNNKQITTVRTQTTNNNNNSNNNNDNNNTAAAIRQMFRLAYNCAVIVQAAAIRQMLGLACLGSSKIQGCSRMQL